MQIKSAYNSVCTDIIDLYMTVTHAYIWLQIYQDWRMEERYGMRVTLAASSIEDTSSLSKALSEFSEKLLPSSSPSQVDVHEATGAGDGKR